MSTDLQAGQKIFLRLRGEDRTFPATVLEATARSLTISTPSFRDVPLDLKPGDEVVGIYAARGVRFIFESRVVDARDEGRIVIDGPLAAVPIQERSNVRQPVQFSVEVTDGGGRTSSLTAVNLSSGGLQILSDRSYAVGSGLRVKLVLPRDFPLTIEVAATVIWTEKVLEEGRLVNRLGLAFVQPAVWQQDEIFRYIFRRMVEERQLSRGPEAAEAGRGEREGVKR